MPKVTIFYALRPLDRTNVLVQETVANLTKWLKEKGIDYESLGGYLLRKPTILLSPALLQHTGLVVFISHGTPSAICGSAFLAESFPSLGIINKQNEHLLKDKIVVALSCFSLQGLGDYTKAFVGFKERLLGREIADLDADKVNDFIDTYTVPIKILLMGGTVEEATEHFKRACEYYMDIAKEKGLVETEFYKSMARNSESVGFKGDGTARLF